MRSLHAELHALVSRSMTPKTSYHITLHVLRISRVAPTCFFCALEVSSVQCTHVNPKAV